MWVLKFLIKKRVYSRIGYFLFQPTNYFGETLVLYHTTLMIRTNTPKRGMYTDYFAEQCESLDVQDNIKKLCTVVLDDMSIC